MATINHTQPLNTLKDLRQNKGDLQQYATHSDGDLIRKVWGRDTSDLSTCEALLNELAIRFELEVFGSC